MSYTKTVWRNNQAPAINADNLNHIEQGIESAHNQMAINTSDIETLTTQVQGNASNIASEISARQSGDSLLQSQIDQLVAPTGEAPSAAEVENARIGDDGVTYDTLGNAIRGQFSDVKSELTGINITLDTLNDIEFSYNQFNLPEQGEADFGAGYLSNGSVVSASGYKYTNYIPIKGDQDYVGALVPVYGSASYPWWNCPVGIEFYDVNKVFISDINPTTQTFHTPLGARYMRFNCSIGTTNVRNKTMIVEGSTVPTTYQAFTKNVLLTEKLPTFISTLYNASSKSSVAEQVDYNIDYFDGNWANVFYQAVDGVNKGYSSTYISSDAIPVSDTDTITIESEPATAIARYTLFYASNDSFLGYRSGTDLTPYTGAAYFRVEYQFSSSIDASTVAPIKVYLNKGTTSKEKVAQLTTDVNNIRNAMTEIVEMSLSFTTGKIFSLVTKDYYNYTTGEYCVVEKGTLEEIWVTAKFNANFPPVVYLSGSVPSAVTYLGSNACGVTTTGDPEIVSDYLVNDIPAGCTHILFQSSRDNFTPSFKTEKYIDFSQLNKSIRAVVDSEILRVYTAFADSTLMVEFGKRGVNNIADFRYISVGTTPIYSNSTDWHSPLIVGAVSNIDGGHPNNQYFTGGNHAYDNSASGVASGRTSSLKYFIDGEEVTEFDGHCDNVRIEWTNMVQGYNTEKADGTGREIMQENHRLVFDGYQWTSDVTYIALEDVIFRCLYGFQCSGTSTVFPNMRYIGGANRGLYTGGVDSNSGNKTCNLFVAYGTLFRIEMEVDPTIDLGNREHYTGTEGCFNRDYGKAYFNFLTDFDMLEDESCSIRGIYRFLPV